MPTPGWPAYLTDGRITLRPPRRRDGPAWASVRRRSQEWLEQWEALPMEAAHAPWRSRQTLAAWQATVRITRGQARAGTALPWVVVVDGELSGQLGLADITRGAALTASLGYWVDQRVAGRGVGLVSVAMALDHAFNAVGLHRVEALVRPANEPSLRLLSRLGFREEGLAVRSLAVNGAWRDHVLLALTREEVPLGGLLAEARRRFPRDTPGQV